MTQSILRNLLFAFLGFGIAMGAIFPLYAAFFVDFLPGMKGWFIIGCLVAGTSIGIINYMLLKRLLIRRLQQIAQVVNSVNRRDLSQRCDIQSDDVIGEIIASFNLMSDTLCQVIRKLQGDSQSLADGVNVITSNIHANTQSMVQQQDGIRSATQAITELTGLANTVSHIADDTASQINSTSQKAQEGRRNLGIALQTLRDLDDTAAQSATTVSEVQNSSQSIAAMVQVIEDISEQTNLLALNAAIEAARAGEQGRGFAVVADEVRTLAQRTQEATVDIQGLINALRQSSERMISSAQLTREKTAGSLTQTEEATQRLGEIATAMQDTAASVETLVSNAADQDQQAQAVKTAMDKNLMLSQASRERAEHSLKNSAHIEGVAASLKELTSSFRC